MNIKILITFIVILAKSKDLKIATYISIINNIDLILNHIFDKNFNIFKNV